ncbi:MAG: sigma-70 family RNA polymerase sigma factor [Clostridia bacterium]
MAHETLEMAMTKLKAGDKGAFDYIYDHTYKVVFFVAHQILRDSSAAEDIVQETYVAAYKNLDKYQSNTLLAWLATIAKRLAINEYNKRKHNVYTDFSVEGDHFGGEESMPDADSFGIIKLAEQHLSPEDFQIVIMYAVSGYKRREIAECLNMPVSTVSYRYSQAISSLENILNKKGGGAK